MMLNLMRKNAQSLFIQVIVVVIAIVFIFWGVGTNLKNSSSGIAVVNGDEITPQAFNQSYERTVERYKQQFGGQLPEKLLESMRLKEQVVSQLVQRMLLRQGAERMGISVGKDATQREIQAMPAFSQDGHFDLQRYQAILANNHLAPAAFEHDIHDDILINRTVTFLGQFAGLADADINDWMGYINEEVNIAYAAFQPADFLSKIKVSDADLKQWYEAHKTDYKTAPQVKLAYLSYPFAGMHTSVTDEAMRTYYQAHLDEYQVPERRRVRHIFIGVPENATSEVKAAKKDEAEKALEEIRQGADFVATVQRVSDQPDKGGDLGFISRDDVKKLPFMNVLFSLKKDDVSDLVEAPNGYFIFKVEDIIPATTRTFDMEKPSIEKLLAEKNAKAAAFKNASDAYEAIMHAGSLAKYSTTSGAAVKHTDFFTQAKPPQLPLVTDAAFLTAAFALHKGELSSVVETPSGYAILFAEDIKEPEVPAMNVVRERVTADYSAATSAELARAAAEADLKKARETGKWPEGLARKESGYVKRAGADSDLPEVIRKSAFAHLNGGPFPDHVVTEGTTCYLYQNLDSRQGKSDWDAAKREQFVRQLNQSQQTALLSSWLEQFRKDSKIWINQRMLK